MAGMQRERWAGVHPLFTALGIAAGLHLLLVIPLRFALRDHRAFPGASHGVVIELVNAAGSGLSGRAGGAPGSSPATSIPPPPAAIVPPPVVAEASAPPPTAMAGVIPVSTAPDSSNIAASAASGNAGGGLGGTGGGAGDGSGTGTGDGGDGGPGAGGTGSGGSVVSAPVPLAIGLPHASSRSPDATLCRLRVFVLVDGTVGRAEPLDHAPADSAALAAARGLRFRPATLNGRAVPAWTTVEIGLAR